MKEPKLRTEEEIDAMIQKGREFVEKHPVTMFGDDNTESFELFENMVKYFREKNLRNYPYAVRDELNDFLDGELEVEEDEEENRNYTHGLAVIDWLMCEEDELY